LRIARHFPEFKGQRPEQLLAWVEEILRQYITDRWRHDGAAKRDLNREVPGGELLAGLAGDSTSPDERVARDDDYQRVLSAIEELPDRERQVVRLRLVEGRSSDEVARELRVSEGNVRVILFRAVNRLRQQLGEQT
jgi:RNA polymerase sigma factor (sigma-70 family)